MARAVGRFGSPTTGLLGIVVAIVVVLIALVAPAGAIAYHNTTDTVAGTRDGANQLSATADRSASSSRRDAGAVGSYVYDHASTRASDDAGVSSAPDREVLATEAADAAGAAGKQGCVCSPVLSPLERVVLGHSGANLG